MAQQISQETLLKIQELVEKEGWKVSSSEMNMTNTFLMGHKSAFRCESTITLEFYKSEIVTNER